MKLVTSEQMRNMDRRMTSDYGVSGEELMDRAGHEVAQTARYLADVSGYDNSVILLIAGRGNNGGDAFAAARHLKDRGADVEVWLAGEADAVGGDALKHLGRMRSAGIRLRELPTKSDWEDALAWNEGSAGSVVVDGVLGIGSTGPARGPAAGAIRFVKTLADRNLILSIDVPSGLNADTGEAEGDAVIADMTLTIGFPKRGLVEPRAVNFVGTLEVADIGIPHELSRDIESDKELITAHDLRGLIARRQRDAHKGNFGHLLAIGGASGYAGAIAMASRAALRSGVGLVTAIVPKCISQVVACIVPEAMVHSATETEAGSLSGDCLSKWNRSINDFDAVLIGPGMTMHDQTRLLVERVMNECRKPVLMDADALNVCAGYAEVFKASHAPLVLTPHPGEMARFMGCRSEDVQSDRFKWAGMAAESTKAVIVLKGAGTVVAQKGSPLSINLNGNPGMATGGMGDVLSGLIAGLIAQRIAPFDAARLGVYLHGRAGDGVAWRGSQAGMLATDVIEELPGVFREVTVR